MARWTPAFAGVTVEGAGVTFEGGLPATNIAIPANAGIQRAGQKGMISTSSGQCVVQGQASPRAGQARDLYHILNL
ncbi:hypothetical protein TH44_15910 [Thalassospira xiamenensis]|uniref:Uncharacterized protein n=1 Tax=Thalassospira xiamenensis TaxID=220697 RepID=A0A367X4T3_9PROT|nr:hypothetical protein AUP41_00735 [Thalassospira xiamenensis]RCK48597.1 hypothetical protein TH44_15910 [Thalassospira xiamenensis]